MAKGAVKDPIRKDRAEKVQAAITRLWEARAEETLSITRAGRRLEFYRPPDVITDEDGEIIGVDAWVRLYNVNTGAEIRIDPHRRIVNPPTVPRAGVRDVPDPTDEDPGRTRRELTVDAAEAFVEAVVDSIQTAPNPRGWRTAGTVTTVYDTTTDPDLASVNATYTTARAGGTLTNPASNQVVMGQNSTGGVFVCWEAFLGFDTSGIPDGDVVSAAVLELYLVTDNTAVAELTCNAREFDWGPTLTTADWRPGANLSALPLLASIGTTSIGATGAYKAWTSDPAFLTATNMKTGTVRVVLCSSRQEASSAPGVGTQESVTFADAETSGTTQDPKLTITHAAPPIALPLFQNNPPRIWRRF